MDILFLEEKTVNLLKSFQSHNVIELAQREHNEKRERERCDASAGE